jgi:hypothetical protein
MKNKIFIKNAVVIGIIVLFLGTSISGAAILNTTSGPYIRSLDGETYFPYLEVNLETGTQILYPTDDGYINNKNIYEQLGNYPDLAVRNRYGEGSDIWECDMLYRFDLSVIPPETQINSASLNLYYFMWKDTDPVGRPLTVYKITSDWDEMSVTFATKPSIASEVSSESLVPDTTNVWIGWDLTRDVQDFVNNPETNFGWQIMDETYWGTFNVPNAHFYSKEYVPPADPFTPYLEVLIGNETQTYSPSDDVYINNKNPDEQLGNYEDLAVRNRYGAGSDIWECDMLYRFDLSSISPGTLIDSASLNLYYVMWKDTNPAGRPYTVYQVTSDWHEMTITYSTKPAIATTPCAVQYVPENVGSAMTWDLTAAVQYAIDNPDSNYGWQIMDEKYWGTYNVPNAHFYSKEYGAPPETFKPALLLGRISNTHTRSESISFEATNMHVILLSSVQNPLFYHSEGQRSEVLTIRKQPLGLFTPRFILAFCEVLLPE